MSLRGLALPVAVEPKVVRELTGRFRRAFGAEPTFVLSASGRINVMGDHTDHQFGLAVPASIDKRIVAAVRANPDAQELAVVSRQFKGRVSLPLSHLPTDVPPSHWSRYLASAAIVLQRYAKARGKKLRGAQLYLDSDIPVGSGLSSSAALELLALMAMAQVSGLKLSRLTLAKLGQKAEHHYGVNCGLLDQFAIAFGRAGQLSLVDFKTLKARRVSVDLGDYAFAIGFTTERSLVDSKYEQRVAELREGLTALRRLSKRKFHTLSDVPRGVFQKHRRALPVGVAQRVEHVLGENERVKQLVAALGQGDVHGAGAIIEAAHRSYRDLFDGSVAQVEAMLDSLHEFGSAVGEPMYGRLMGGGWGGPTLLLVPRRRVAQLENEVGRRYRKKTGRLGRFWPVRIEDGLRQLVGTARVANKQPLLFL